MDGWIRAVAVFVDTWNRSVRYGIVVVVAVAVAVFVFVRTWIGAWTGAWTGAWICTWIGACACGCMCDGSGPLPYGTVAVAVFVGTFGACTCMCVGSGPVRYGMVVVAVFVCTWIGACTAAFLILLLFCNGDDALVCTVLSREESGTERGAVFVFVDTMMDVGEMFGTRAVTLRQGGVP